MSRIFFLFVGEALLFYSTNLNSLLVGSSKIDKFRKSIYLIEFVSVLFLCGEICKVLEDAVGQWAYQSVVLDSTNTMSGKGYFNVLINEAKSHVCGIN